MYVCMYVRVFVSIYGKHIYEVEDYIAGEGHEKSMVCDMHMYMSIEIYTYIYTYILCPCVYNAAAHTRIYNSRTQT
jgi:hypothetical protein